MSFVFNSKSPNNEHLKFHLLVEFGLDNATLSETYVKHALTVASLTEAYSSFSSCVRLGLG